MIRGQSRCFEWGATSSRPERIHAVRKRAEANLSLPFHRRLCSRLECVVNALCRGLSHASTSLARLVLDMNLSGEQVSRVCDALRDCVQVQALHLPHLGCGCEGLASVAELLKERPLLALNLAGSWGAKNEDPSSSGISMGKTLPFCFISLLFFYLFIFLLLLFFFFIFDDSFPFSTIIAQLNAVDRKIPKIAGMLTRSEFRSCLF